ncbi:MAG: UDP-N-acetylmuramoyl-L-alanyl-D-glutamate--2,6-diaminopimelate ligase [Chloroflexi bacterium]|nr:UDP-N-acetylmuramoyl-L-alanyl-D-glutamate--2,6-diaminopimelate ligase [Chloroflexota bacterium]
MISADLLLSALPQAQPFRWRPQSVRAVVCDSRQVQPGDLFVAIPGVNVDGHRFVPDALRAGAVAVVVERMLPELEGMPTILVPNAREAFAYLHAALRGFPAHKLRVIGVTGTDGKTTTTRLIASILRAAGHLVGTVDSVAATIGDEERDTGFHTTTPDAPEVQAYLAEMVARGAEYAVLESTSHGLAQHRVAACEYDVAVVTNITHEHLDYHGTYEAYRAAKGMLFQALSRSLRKPGMPKVAVLNADDASYEYLRQFPADRQITYGLEADAEVTARDIVTSPSALVFRVCGPQGEMAIHSPLVGRYNAHNILAAMSVGLALGLPPEAMREGVAAMRGVEGRMERIDLGQPFTVIVDFAHTPNALEKALLTARELAGEHKVTVVFGCAGLRDRAKRPWMGEIAGRLADRTIITAEDPRTESLEAIMAEIAAGCEKAGAREGERYWRVGDRAEAIALAVQMARPGDVVVSTGKGHERSLCFGTTEYPWSDQEAAREALRRLGYGS